MARWLRSSVCSVAIFFSAASAFADNATFLWDFGAGASPSTSTDQNPVGISFDTPGVKIIFLTVTRFGCTESVSDSIIVSAASCGNKKILVCHKGKPLCINANALPAHIAHGDCAGNCTASGARLAAITNDEEITSGEIELTIAPNPFEESSTLSFTIPEDDYAEITLYNYMGQAVRNLFAGKVAGNTTQNLIVASKGLQEGIYFLMLRTSNEVKNIKLIIRK